MIGEKLKPIFQEIQLGLLDNYDLKPEFDNETFEAITFIFITALSDKMFDLIEKENIGLKDGELMAIAAGNEVHELVKKYTNINTKL